MATLRAQGTTNEEPLIVTAHADGASNASGQVTNPGQVAITGVAVFAPGSTTLVGDLAPGETKAFKLERIDAGRLGQEQLGQKVWTDPSLGPNNPFGIPVAVVNVGGALPPPPLPGVATAPAVAAIGGSRDADFGLWGTLSAKRGQALYPPGMVRAVGWRFGQTSDIGAGTTVQATELVTAVVPVGIGMGKLQRASVRSMNITSPFADPTGTSNGMAVSMFRIPAAATDRQIEAVLSVGVGSKIEVWSAGQWVTLDEASSRHYLIPSPVSSTGVVLIRSAIPFNGGPPMAFMTSLEEVG